MATVRDPRSSVESSILDRLFQPEQDDMEPRTAEALLKLRFGQRDLDRLNELVSKNQEDALSEDERGELESYLRISSMLDLMHAKARRSLKRKG